jgi:hypothetical protein
MITNESAIHSDSVPAHALLHIHLERMIVLSQLQRSVPVGRTRRAKSQANFRKGGRSREACILLALLLLLGFGVAHAQFTAGSIRGVVQDKTGAVVPDSRVTLHSNDESTDHVVMADASGAFLLENLKPGKFSLRAERNGFAATNLTGIVLNPRQDLRLTVELAVAETSTTVEVSSAADQIDTENATLGDIKTNEEMTQLPSITVQSRPVRWERLPYRRTYNRTVPEISPSAVPVHRW